MQFRVVVPSNVKPGQMLRIRCPDGTEGDVRVPKGLKPGNSFIFEMPTEEKTSKPLLSRPSFFDREIMDKQDFLNALAVGLCIGMSIVLGFLIGVLLVTDP